MTKLIKMQTSLASWTHNSHRPIF